jgi:two-component system sensor histidine kinase MprB
MAQAHFPHSAFTLRASDSPAIIGQPSALLRALVNLLDNAAKFGPAKQTIDMHLRSRGSAAQISVLDRCPTTSATEHEKIFQRLHRTDTARAVPGSGLGLAIVAQTAAAHSGTITVSARPGGGNIFQLTLPATPGTKHDAMG